MGLDRFQKYYELVGYWKFWVGVLGFALVAYGLLLVFTEIVGPYVVGLWLIWVVGH